jgi:hypothetical protein
MTELENKANGLLQREVDGKLLSSKFIKKKSCLSTNDFACSYNKLAGWVAFEAKAK